jgi:hypothetical protein
MPEQVNVRYDRSNEQSLRIAVDVHAQRACHDRLGVRVARDGSRRVAPGSGRRRRAGRYPATGVVSVALDLRARWPSRCASRCPRHRWHTRSLRTSSRPALVEPLHTCYSRCWPSFWQAFLRRPPDSSSDAHGLTRSHAAGPPIRMPDRPSPVSGARRAFLRQGVVAHRNDALMRSSMALPGTRSAVSSRFSGTSTVARLVCRSFGVGSR